VGVCSHLTYSKFNIHSGVLENEKKRDELLRYFPVSQYLMHAHSIQRQTRFFSNLVCEAIGTAATPGLLCQPRVIMKMIMEKQMECRLARETEVLGEKTCPSATFVHHKIPHDQTRV
jgi:hypothetical protein